VCDIRSSLVGTRFGNRVGFLWFSPVVLNDSYDNILTCAAMLSNPSPPPNLPTIIHNKSRISVDVN
jgi:hypothetical protein